MKMNGFGVLQKTERRKTFGKIVKLRLFWLPKKLKTGEKLEDLRIGLE